MVLILFLLLFGFLPYIVNKEHLRAIPLKCSLSDSFLVLNEFFQPGDIVIGQVTFLSLLPSFNTAFTQAPTPEMNNKIFVLPKNYQDIMALIYAIEEINTNPSILPNITLGFRTYNCLRRNELAYKASLQLLSSHWTFFPNYKCGPSNNLIAIIAARYAGLSVYVSNIINTYKIPQFTVGSLDSRMIQKTMFQFLYRMVPDDAHEYAGIVQLIHHFKWTWIGIFCVDTNAGEIFLETLNVHLSKNHVCIDFIQKMPAWYRDNRIHQLYFEMNKVSAHINSKSNVFVVYGSFVISSIMIMTEHVAKLPVGKVWLLTTHWEFAIREQTDRGIQLFHSAIAISVHSNEPLEFKAFLKSIDLSLAKENCFIQDFWEATFKCSLKSAAKAGKPIKSCSEKEKLENLPISLFEMSMTGNSYAVYNAVHAVARAVHAMYEFRSPNTLRSRDRNVLSQVLQSWQLHHLLKRISFNNCAGETISFGKNQELIAGFDITNWIAFPNGSFALVKLGSLNLQAPLNKQLTIQDENIVWPRKFNQVLPVSVCNEPCQPGYSRKKKEGEPFCCYDCLQCPERKISNQTDMDDCFECSEAHYSNLRKNQCIPKVVSYLSYGEPLGMSLAFSVVPFALMTVMVIRTFMKHRDTPIVKANNLELSYILLISLLLCFLCPLLFIGEPEPIICFFQQAIFGIVFTVALSNVLAKTITAGLAFMAKRPGSAMRNLMGKKLAMSIVFAFSFIQVGICTIWLSISPPHPYNDTKSLQKEIIVECKDNSSSMFCCILGYMSSLAIVSFIVAFFTRKLPDSYNEAKFISFSMLVFCSVWLCFLPAYLSTKGKYLIAVKVFSIISSSAALLIFTFFPKCYIIVFKPELNNKKHITWKI